MRVTPVGTRKIPKALWVATIVLAVLANAELLQAGNSGLLISSAIAALVVYKVTLWADAYEHETRESLIFTGIFGCGVSVLVTIFLYELIPGSSDSNFVVALVEEGSKALVLLPLIRLHCAEIPRLRQGRCPNRRHGRLILRRRGSRCQSHTPNRVP